MQFLQNSRRIARFLKPIITLEANPRSVSSVSHIPSSFNCLNHASPSPSVLKGMDNTSSFSLLIPRLSFSSETAKLEGDHPTVTVKELHGKILDSVNVKRSMPPNAWLWSLIESCQNQDDINLLFEVLQKLRRFRLSNLRIHDNFNSNLCQQVAKTCVRVGAIDSDKLELLGKYSKKFSEAGVKLRKTTFDVWMDFAAKRGDTESLRKTDKLRSETYNQHTLSTAFSCAKGFLLESKPEEAAAVIQLICQTYGDVKRSAVSTEFKKLVNEWPVEVIRRQPEEDKKALADSLKSVIPSMVNALLSLGLNVSVDLEELYKKDALLC